MDKSEQTQITIRKASQQDIDTTIRIWRNAELTHKPKGRDTKENLHSQLRLPQICVFIAAIKGKDVGTIMVSHDGRKGWLNRLAVLKKYRNKGIAQKLIAHSENWLASQGLEIYATLIDDPNDPSMNLFMKAGYTKHNDIVYFTKKLNPDV
ncbi:MAG: GNAT family N-acetyltransferase [Candidatus Cloacimonetes bacterium]|nr:GNAT family N-acetyltransferase [Candidatus Cloacimonadota bacterium]